MGQGKVAVNSLNMSQGEFPEIERKALIIGVGATGIDTVITVNAQSDLDVVLGSEVSAIKTMALAAQLNGGANWFAYLAPHAVETIWQDVLDAALVTVSPEVVVLCAAVTTKAEVDAVQTKAQSLRTQSARRCVFLVATAGIDAGLDDWATYETAQIAIQDSVEAYRVALVPLLHGNDVGILAGRLCRHEVSIADSPMRVATGSVSGLGVSPVDVNGVELSDATLANLDSNRLSCIQHYPDYAGTYWGDCNLLDAPGGDFQVVEHLRIVDKVCREVRLLSIVMVANRSINQSPVSQVSTRSKLAKPMRDMSKSITVNGVVFPGECVAPGEGSVVLNWESATKLTTYIKVRPVGAPKDITDNIMLDLSQPA